MPYYVYIILCEGGSFYTGYTKNVDSRLRLHFNGRGARYTRMHKPMKLVHTERFSSRAEAMKRERNVKTMSHKQKTELADSNHTRDGGGNSCGKVIDSARRDKAQGHQTGRVRVEKKQKRR